MNKPHQGEILLLLSNRSQLSKADIAHQLNLNRSSLSRCFKSENLTMKVKKAAAAFFDVDISIFDGVGLEAFPGFILEEPEVIYKRKDIEAMDGAEVLKHLEAKDRRHHEERMRLLVIIENLTKK